MVNKIKIMVGVVTLIVGLFFYAMPMEEELYIAVGAELVTIDKVVQSKDIGTSTVEYSYISSEKVSADDYYFSGEGEFSDGIYLQKGAVKQVAFNGVKVYRDKAGEVFRIKKATTTKSEFTKLKPTASIFKIPLAFAQSTSTTYTANGNWVAPAGITSADVACWGGGGMSVNTGAGGGGGGAYAATAGVTVIPATSYAIVVGIGGKETGDGEGRGASSTFNGTTVLAQGGQQGSVGTTIAAGSGGLASVSIGTTKFNGGNGGTGNNSNDVSGGGGGAGGPSGAGVVGEGGGLGVCGAAAGGVGGAGNNGSGGAGGSCGNGTGIPGRGGFGTANATGGGGGGGGDDSIAGGGGGAPGGGGGGGGDGSLNRANGADGQCIVTWVEGGASAVPGESDIWF